MSLRLTAEQCALVIAKTHFYFKEAERIYAKELVKPEVLFDLVGATAGMYRMHADKREIRYNSAIFAKYFTENLEQTVPHEVAHSVTEQIFGWSRRIKPHGKEWREVMLNFNAEPAVTADFDMSGIPMRREQRHAYKCECGQQMLSSRRHNRFVAGKAEYRCLNCKTLLSLA